MLRGIQYQKPATMLNSGSRIAAALV